MILAQLYLAFAQIGLFTFGGGYAMIPIIEQEIIINRGWLTPPEFIDIVAIAEMTPGPIAVNCATFVGYKMAGIVGGVTATLGVITPSTMIVLAIAVIAGKYMKSDVFTRIKAGLRPAVIGLMLAAAMSVARAVDLNWQSAIIGLASGFMLWRLKIEPIVVLVVSGVMGIVLFGSF